jgi:hypothetical protein
MDATHQRTPEQEQWFARRDDILRRLAWKEYWVFLKENNPEQTIPPYEDRKDIALIGMHKLRYELSSMGRALRQESRAWLEVRGYGRYRGLPWPPSEVLEDELP